MYTWICNNSEVLGFTTDCISIALTLILTVGIFLLERHHTKVRELLEDTHQREREALETKAKQQSISEAARIFTIDNDDEIEFLPLCEIASQLQFKRKHCRGIITRFLRCSRDVQKEILRQNNYDEMNITEANISYALDCIQKDFDKHSFGENILYDGAKYFHRALRDWSDKSISHYNNYIFDNLRLKEYKASFRSPLFQSETTSLLSYMYDYLELNQHDGIIPPINEMKQKTNWTCCDESATTYWTMRVLINGCHSLHNPDIENIEEEILETQEDMYYYTVLVLYKTYCVDKSGESNDKT